MPIYEIGTEGFIPANATSFDAEGLKERADIQHLLRLRIESLGDGLLVLAEEFSGWVDSARRIDLLCLDTDANLVVVELKRTEDGGHMELQSLRYAAMIATMTFDTAVETLARTRNPVAPDTAAARAEILSFLKWDEPQESAFAMDTRIILAAADFSKELTTTVMWLRKRGIDLRCVRLKPYRLADGRVLVDIHPLIPLPEEAEFQTRLGAKEAAERRERMERHDLRVRFLLALQARAATRTPLHAGRAPSDSGVLNGAAGRSGFTLNYVTGRATSRVELLIQTNSAKTQLAALMQHRDDVEKAFGAPLIWQEKEASLQCRVYWEGPGGYRSLEAEWPAIQDVLVDKMIRLDKALRPRIQALPP